MASFFRPASSSAVLMLAAIGCGGSNQPAAPAQPTAAPALPPAPPSSQSAGGDRAPPTAPATASQGDIPVWAGQRQDEPFAVKQFLASRSAPPNNAAPFYQSAFALVSSELGDRQAAALEGRIRQVADIDKLVAGAIPAEQIEQALAAAAPAIDRIDAAQTRPECVFVTGLTVDARLPHAMAARTIAQCSILQLAEARTKGDFAMAETAIRRSLRLSRDLRPRGPGVCQLVSIAADGMLLAAIEHLTLKDPSLTVEQCDRLLALLLEHQQQGLDRAAEGLKVEYIIARNSIHDLQSGRLSPQQLVEFTSGDQEGSPPRLPQLDYDAEIAACNRLFSLLLAEAPELAVKPESASRFRAELEKITSAAQAARPHTQRAGKSEVPLLVLLLIPGTDTICHANCRIEANLAGISMLTALKRYEVAHGHLPESLDVAAGETALKTTPMDPYSNEPLRFAMVAGKPTIYSTGKDLKDDGGEVDWKFGSQPGDYLFVLNPRAETKLAPPATGDRIEAATPALPPPTSQLRTWTSTAGTTIEAELVRVEGSFATLKKQDGSAVQVPLDKLSREDQDWIDARREDR